MSFRAAGKKVNVGDTVSVKIQSAQAQLGLQGVRIDKIRKLASQSERDVRVESDLGDDTSDAVGGSEDRLVSLRPVSAAICRTLEMLGPDEKRDRWLAEVWAFFARSHHLRVKTHSPLPPGSEYQQADRPAELSVAPQGLEDVIAELPTDSIVKGYVVDSAQEDPKVNLSPSISIVVGEADREKRECEPGEPVFARVRDVRPRWGWVSLTLKDVFEAKAPLPPLMESIMRIYRKSIADELGVSIEILKDERSLIVRGAGSSPLDDAIKSLEQFLSGCSVLAKIPKDKKGLVIGKNGSTIQSYRERPGILHCDFAASTRLLIAADSVDNLNNLLLELKGHVYPVERKMQVPAGKNGRLIGTGGATVKSLCEKSGCSSAGAVGRGSEWLVKGPNEESIKSFVNLAEEVVPGCRLATEPPSQENEQPRSGELRPSAPRD